MAHYPGGAMIDNDDAFESAATAAAAEIGIPEPTSGADDDVSAAATVRPVRGRPRGGHNRPRKLSHKHSAVLARRRRREQSAAPGESDAVVTQQAGAAPPPPPEVKLAPLPPERLLPVLRQLDKSFTRLIGTTPLDEQELKDGAEACAPVLDHYAPLFLSQPWAPAVIWAGMVYGPRVVEVYDKRKAGGGRKSVTFPVSPDPGSTSQGLVS